jgi:hypothetical protein
MTEAERLQSFKQFFNPYDNRILQAYEELTSRGVWPDWFRQEMKAGGIEFPQEWQVMADALLAKAWVHHRLGLPPAK